MLYQLYQHQFEFLPDGLAIRINAPFDTYGYILKPQDNGTYLIRGTGANPRSTY